MLMINSYFLKSTVWAKLNIPAGWKWFVEVQCVTSVRGITPSKKKKNPMKILWINPEVLGSFDVGLIFLFLSSSSRFPGRRNSWFKYWVDAILILPHSRNRKFQHQITEGEAIWRKRGWQHLTARKTEFQLFVLLPSEMPKWLSFPRQNGYYF